MKNIHVNPEDILENRFEKEDVKFYLRNFGFVAISVIAMIVMLIDFMVMGRTSVRTGLFGIIVTLMLAGCIAGTMMFVRKRNNSRLRSYVDKYGKETLVADLSDPEKEVFWLHETKKETYVVITSNYIYFSKEAVFKLSEIEHIDVDMYNKTYEIRAGKSNDSPYNPTRTSTKETVRFIKPVSITTTGGVPERIVVALERPTLEEFSKFCTFLNRTSAFRRFGFKVTKDGTNSFLSSEKTPTAEKLTFLLRLLNEKDEIIFWNAYHKTDAEPGAYLSAYVMDDRALLREEKANGDEIYYKIAFNDLVELIIRNWDKDWNSESYFKNAIALAENPNPLRLHSLDKEPLPEYVPNYEMEK